MRIGSAFSGVGALELGVRAVLGGQVAWHAEPDKACRRVLAARFPGVPNLGDVTEVDWTRAEPVEVLCAGFPCQDVSLAGRGAGLAHGSRTGLWRPLAEAIDVLRPPLVLLENVRGLLSGRADRGADSELGSCGWCLEEDGPPALRALGAVLGDLASRGYDARWTSVRACDVGAPHERWRVFVAAAPADADGVGWDRWHRPGGQGGVAEPADADRGAVEWRQFWPALARWERLTRPSPAPVVASRGVEGVRLSARFSEWMMGLPDGWVDVPGVSESAQLRMLGNAVVPAQAAAAVVELLGVAEPASLAA